MLDEELSGTNYMIVKTFDNNNHIFNYVEEDGLNYFKIDTDSRLISRIIIKPDLWVFFKDGGYEHGIKLLNSTNNLKTNGLVSNCYIDPNIFNNLVNKGLISYSKAMADLYDLPTIYSRDIKYHQNDYKRTKNKELVLSKMRQGIFN